MSIHHLIGGVREPSPRDTTFLPAFAAPIGVTLEDIPWDEWYLANLAPFQFQDSAGACVAHGFTDTIDSDARNCGAMIVVKTNGDLLEVPAVDGLIPSYPDSCRMDVYYGGRRYRGWEKEDSGLLMSDAARWLEEEGVIPEAWWPYDSRKVTTETPPNDDATRRTRALNRVRFRSLPMTPHAAAVFLATERRGCPVSFRVGPSYVEDAAKDGWMRDSSVEANLGGHCEWLCGASKKIVVPGYGPGAVLMRGSWRRSAFKGAPHGLYKRHDRFSSEEYGYTWVPFALLAKSTVFWEVFGLVQGLEVEV